MPPNAHRRATIADVARAAGVSRGTVSRYLNGGHWVSPEAQQAVRKAIKDTGYVASATARQLRTGRSRTVAFLVDEEPAIFFADPNFEVLVAAVSDELAARNLSMVVLLAGSEEHADRAVDFLRSGAVAGVVTASAHARYHTLEKIVDAGVPVVNCGFPRTMADRISYVMADEVMGGTLLGEHLVASGATRIGVVAGPEDSPGGTLRLDAFREAVGECLPPYNIRFGDYTRASGRSLTADLLDDDPAIDCIFAASDVMAAGALEELRGRGRAVPDEVLLAGFDDSVAARQTSPKLTTVRQPFDVISRQLVDVLMREVDDGVRAAITVPVELVVRESTRR